MIIEVPDWCVLGKTIEWHAPEITGNEWVRDKIIAFGYDGFFHQSITVQYISQGSMNTERR